MKENKVDLLVLAAHPDDAELGAGGTIARHISLGYTVAIVDFTQGELGTRGTAETRRQEAADAAAILKVSARENLGLADGFFENRREDQLKVIAALRKFQPKIVLANALHDRHSDHGRAAELAFDACFLAGLAKVETFDNGKPQSPWRPSVVYHYIQSQMMIPDFVVDVSDFWETKMKAIRAFRSQFYDPASKEPESYISTPAFMNMVEARGTELGHAIGAKYGEGFVKRRVAGVRDLNDLM